MCCINTITVLLQKPAQQTLQSGLSQVKHNKMFDETYSSLLSSIQVPKLTSTTTNSSSSLSHVYHNNHNPQHRNPHELFVGNVSFFCQENQLLELFGTIGLVTHCQIVRNEGHRRARPLLYAFVCMSTRKEAMQAIKAINGMMFMGRNLM